MGNCCKICDISESDFNSLYSTAHSTTPHSITPHSARPVHNIINENNILVFVECISCNKLYYVTIIKNTKYNRALILCNDCKCRMKNKQNKLNKLQNNHIIR